MIKNDTNRERGLNMRKKQVLSLLGLGIAFFLAKPHLLYANPTFGGGSGTKQDPYRLSTPEHLTQLQVAVDEGNSFSGEYFILTNDIDFTGYDNDNDPSNGNFNPIGESTVDYHFSGILDGKNHSILNLNISLPNKSCVGLFAQIDRATIRNLKLKSVNIQGSYFVGGITGNATDSTIQNVFVSDFVSGEERVGGVIGNGEKVFINQALFEGDVSGNESVGGVAGGIYSSELTKNSSSATVSGQFQNVGGLIGISLNSTIKFNEVSGEIEGSDYVGGLVGWTKLSYIGGNSMEVEVEGSNWVGGAIGLSAENEVFDNATQGIVVGSGKSIGGFVGSLQNGSTSKRNYSNTNVKGGNYVGGFAGNFSGASQAQDCISNGEVFGLDYVGGFAGSLYANSISHSNYSQVNVEGVSSVGGFVGWTKEANLNQSFAKGVVVGSEFVGGFAGVSSSALENVYFIGDVEGATNVGGLVGNDYSGSNLKNAYHIGSVTGTTNVGRISGWHEDTSVIENVYYNQEENVELPLVGLDESTVSLGDIIGLNLSQMSQTNSQNYMSALDFDNIWVTTFTTPMFQWQKDLVSATEGDIQIRGTVQAVIADVSIPSVSPDLVIDPNSPEGAISPEFSIENQSTSPIRLELKTFEQTTHSFNDVLPDKYDSWEGLNRKESQDIALGLIAKEGDGWQRLTTPTSYVANHSEHEIGVIKPTSQVNFEFDVHHGRAFSESKTVQYKLVFVFDLLS